MRKTYLFITLLMISSSLFGQQEFWRTRLTSASPRMIRNSVLIEKDQTFVSISGRLFYEDSYFLELNKTLGLPIKGDLLDGSYFYGVTMGNSTEPFYFAAQRTGSTDNAIFLNTFRGTDFLEEGFSLPVTFENSDSKGPAAVKVDEEHILIFTNQFFYKVKVSEDGAIEEEWRKNGGYGLIADAKAYNGGYILCTEAGKLIYVNENMKEVWMKNLGYSLFSVLPVNDGLMLTGTINGQAVLIKTSFDGTVIWDKEYGVGEALDIVEDDQGGFVFSGTKLDFNALVVKTDDQGKEIWRREFWGGYGNKILKSQYGGYLMQAKIFSSTTITRISEDGEIGDLMVSPQLKRIAVNNISSSATARGKLFEDDQRNLHTTYPKDERTSTIYSGGLWLAGKNQDGVLHTSMTTNLKPYNSDSASDFVPGPNEGTSTNWDRVWHINKKYIQKLRENVSNGNLDIALPLDLWTYPGAGNPHFNLLGGGQEIVPEDMAPFIDANGDGVYNILDGDYPELKGDEMLWWVMHDPGDSSIIGGNALSIEARCTYYAYGCNESDILFNSAFLEMDLENYSSDTYSDLYLGTVVDFSLGCGVDDYSGTLPEFNAIYAYNADDFDGDIGSIVSVCGGEEVFLGPDQIPIQSVVYLNNDLTHSMVVTRANSFGPPVQPPDLQNQEDIFYFLQSIWADGTPLTENGNGHLGMTPTDYAFPGNPSNIDEWSMCSSQWLLGITNRMLMSAGPKTLLPGETIKLDIGLLAHDNISHPCPDISQVEAEILELQKLYDNGGLDLDVYLGLDLEFESGETIALDAGPNATSYNWSTGSTTRGIEVRTAGVYAVTVTNAAGCEYVDEIKLVDITKINEVQVLAPKVYPNPTSNKIFIEMADDLPQRITLENTLGQELKQFKVAPDTEYSTIELYFGDLPQGMYLLRFHYKEKEKIRIRKVVLRN